MDDATKENWERIKKHLEKVGKTDTMFYKRAVAISKGDDDPLKVK